MTGALDELCAALGLDLEGRDAWGNPLEVSPACCLRLLAALGHPLDEARVDEDAAMHVQSLTEEAGRRALPAMLVVDSSEPLRFDVRRIAPDGRRLWWRIALEGGGEQRGSFDTLDAVLDEGEAREAVIAVDLPEGYHRLSLHDQAGFARPVAEAAVAVCPQRSEPVAGRLWGPSVQVYALRSARDWGMGDFGSLRRLVDLAADAGAHFVGVNPLHALFPHEPERASPYSPSSREWLDVLYLDIEAMRDFGECGPASELVASPAFRERLDALRAKTLVDYAGVAAAKFEVLELLYAHFRAEHLDRGTPRAGTFRDFQREGGRSLRLNALFDALQAHFHAQDGKVWGWTTWPEDYRDANAPAVEAFAQEHEARVEFFEYLQWQAALQLHAVESRARARGMRIGLYRDLAVGVAEAGAETWARPRLHAFDAHVGAPPDELNPSGQDWGFPPLIPQRLADDGYSAFLAVLRANMRHAGALRIDHVMSLMRLFWLPVGIERCGAYVGYPMQDLVRLLCLESRRNACAIIGEDLGIVPPEVRDAMERHGLLSYRPLYFEREGNGFRPPAEWPARAVAVVGTHDLPTLRGYWAGHDVELRHELGIYPDPDMHARERGRRSEAREALADALRAEGLLDASAGTPEPGEGASLATAVYRFLARTPAAMLAVQLEDVLGQLEATNLPGTTEAQQPNWRRRIELELADLAADERWLGVTEAIAAERPSSPAELHHGPPGFRPELADIPRATYRLQFNADFGFAAAEQILPYLADLGISHVYASPFLRARPGSDHGYDIVDHSSLNPEIGSESEFDAYCARLRELGLGQVLDVVPNHVGIFGASNEWWLDVLENGRASVYAGHFDIDWNPPGRELQGKVLLPVLGDQYGVVLEAGELELAFSAEKGMFSVRYFGHCFPVDPCDYPAILAAGAAEGEEARGPVELDTLLAALRRLPPRDAKEPDAIAERRRDKDTFKRHLADLHDRLPALQVRVAAALAAFRGTPGEPASFDALDALLSRQAYRLASWRVAADDINYRRFFDINDLAALRMDLEPVFDATHALIFRWIAEGRATGLRIDHPDGLADPQGYFERLQARHAAIAANAPGLPPTLYLVVEKILGEFEGVPTDWPVHGTTGYRFGMLCNNLFVDAAQESRLSRIYRAFTGEARDFTEVQLEARHLIITHSLPGELGRLAGLLYEIAQYDRHTRDFTRSRLRGALAEIVASFPVYRSYISARGVSDEDRVHVERAVEEAAARGRAGDASVLHFVRDVLLGAPGEPDTALRKLKLGFARRFQQFTSPVMAKALEDTAFYRYHRLVSLNEVGGDPRTFGIGVEDFHVASERAGCFRPFGLLASSTHDSKRSEDVRARIDVLSEMPGAWRLALRRWRAINERRKSRVEDEPAPSRNDEYLLYQTLLGIWPLSEPNESGHAELAARLTEFLLKAAREAKQRTSWMNPEAAYEKALAAFVQRLLATDVPGSFLADFRPFQALVARYGIFNSLNMLLLKLSSPGVPDIYQGCETWNFSLVDPDNRRPADFDAARERLAALQRDFPDRTDPDALRAMLEAPADGRIKLYVLWRALELRRRLQGALRDGCYVPLDVEGPAARHVIAFARTQGRERVVVIATRLLLGLTRGEPGRIASPEAWQGTSVLLPWRGDCWTDAFCARELDAPAGRLELPRIFDPLPFALLASGAPSSLPRKTR